MYLVSKGVIWKTFAVWEYFFSVGYSSLGNFFNRLVYFYTLGKLLSSPIIDDFLPINKCSYSTKQHELIKGERLKIFFEQNLFQPNTLLNQKAVKKEKWPIKIRRVVGYA